MIRNKKAEEVWKWLTENGITGQQFAKAGFTLFTIIFLWSGFFTIDRDENGVVTMFGKHVRTVEPGINLKIPFFESVQKVVVTKINRIEIGYRSNPNTKADEKERAIEAESEMLTGDINMVVLDLVVQYRSRDAAKWLFRVVEPEEAIKSLAQGAMRLVVGGNTFDTVATSGRGQIQEETEKILQKLCDEMDFGVQIVAVQLQDVHPPSDVMESFQDVTNAREEKDKKVRQAEGYRNEQMARVKGDTQKVLLDSEGYRDQRISWSRGDASRFQQVYEKYKQSPEMTLERLRLETLESVISRHDQLIDRTTNGLLKLFDTQKAQQ